MTTYADFLARKMAVPPQSGIDVSPDDTHPMLYPFQRELVSRALHAGRYALFCGTGLGKTAMQVVWSYHVWAEQQAATGRVLIVAPLAVAEQTVREAAKFGIRVTYRRNDDDRDAIVVTNYEMLDRFNADDFVGVVLDESSILKAFDGATRNAIIDKFRETPFKLACTATPSPNDFTELGNHAEFFGVKTRAEMLSEYFIHDGGSTADWRIKGHAVGAFWQWVSSWSVIMSMPSDIGFADDGFVLPPMREHVHVLRLDHSDAKKAGLLFLDHSTSLADQRAVRRATMDRRVDAIRQIVASLPGDESVLIWCELNDEATAVEKSLDGAIQVQGSDSIEAKVDRLLGFADGRYRILVTKPRIAGFGMNWQHCHTMIFAGMSNSFEATYQAIRRCWRFGQRREVDVHFIMAETDTAVADNYKRKAADHEAMSRAMIGMTGGASRQRWNSYEPQKAVEVPSWLTR